MHAYYNMYNMECESNSWAQIYIYEPMRYTKYKYGKLNILIFRHTHTHIPTHEYKIVNSLQQFYEYKLLYHVTCPPVSNLRESIFVFVIIRSRKSFNITINYVKVHCSHI